MTTTKLKAAARCLAATTLVSLTACASGGGAVEAPPGGGSSTMPGSSPSPAPWSAAALAPGEVPDVFSQVWTSADNRAECALLAPADFDGRATPRRATFSGGWGVAFDLPGQRSAFGVAGTGVAPNDQTYDDWPDHITWRDGSRAGYGPEGGSGPNQLAYLTIPSQGCLYNVWSRIGKEHLEGLLESLRFVQAR